MTPEKMTEMDIQLFYQAIIAHVGMLKARKIYDCYLELLEEEKTDLVKGVKKRRLRKTKG